MPSPTTLCITVPSRGLKQRRHKEYKLKVSCLLCLFNNLGVLDLCVHIHYVDILHNAVAKADNDDKQSCQSPLESRDQLSKDQQPWS